MWNVIDEHIGSMGTEFELWRNGENVADLSGIKDGSKQPVMFRKNTEILVGDWLRDERTQAWMYAKDVDHLRGFSGNLEHVEVRYEAEIDYQRRGSTAQMVLALDDIADAIRELGDDEMSPQDRERASESLKSLKGIISGLPQGAAEGIASQVVQRLTGG